MDVLDAVAAPLNATMEALDMAVISGSAARHVANWIIDRLPSSVHGLLDMPGSDKWVWLKAVVELAEETLVIVMGTGGDRT